MGRRSGKSKKSNGDRSSETHDASETRPIAYDKETAMSQASKEEGNRCFQTRDYEGAMLKYERALSLLPRNHTDVSCLRSNMAECYMQLGISEYPRAIRECNLALEVDPKYIKALLKRARCYEGLNKLSLALRDVGAVLKMEHSNLMAIELGERVAKAIERQGSRGNEVPIDLVPLPEYLEPPPQISVSKGKVARKKKKKDGEEEKGRDEKRETCVDKKIEDKLVVEEERISSITEEEDPGRTVKLVFGEDIRWARIPVNCDVFKLRKIISVRFPRCEAVLVKYRDEEGDLVTITTTEELRLAESSVEHGFVKLYIVETSRDQDPLYNMIRKCEGEKGLLNTENGQSESVCISDWIVQFTQIFKKYAEFDIDARVDIHEVGMKLYTDAMEETVTSEEAQDVFSTAAEKFQEMAALALFHWGNVHISRARKKVYFTNGQQVESAYDWAQMEYTKAGKKYEEALKIKPNLYEAVLALGQQQFEQAKLSWYYAVRASFDLETWHSKEVIELYNKAEGNMEKGMQMLEEDRVNELSQPKKLRNGSQIHALWSTMLYERSIMEFKLGLPSWKECLTVAAEKIELAGASSTDVAVMMKNHCGNDTSSEGCGFNINEIGQAWNEMFKAKNWRSGIQSFRLEPLLRRRVSKLYHAMEHA